MVAERTYTSPPLKLKRVLPMAEPQHPYPFDISTVPAWAWVLGISQLLGAGLKMLGWDGKAVFSWLARIFESNAAREQKIQDEVNRRKSEEDDRAWRLADQMRADDKKTIDQLWVMVGDLQRVLGQTQQSVDENAAKIKQVEQKADIAQVLANPEVLNRIEAQAKEPEQ